MRPTAVANSAEFDERRKVQTGRSKRSVAPPVHHRHHNLQKKYHESNFTLGFVPATFDERVSQLFQTYTVVNVSLIKYRVC